MSHDRVYLWLGGWLLLLSLPARFAALNQSLWMDEAWVANSLLAPSLHDTFFTKTWTQSSPPLFLLLERWTVGLAPSSEAAFRVLPLAASLAGLVFAALALQRWLSPPAALISLTLVGVNYWAIKYPQQAKPYGCDFCLSALLLWMVGRCLESGPSRRRLGALLLVGAGGMYLSYTTVFWLPTLVICAGIPAKPDAADGLRWSDLRWKRFAWAAGLLIPALAILQLVFIGPNHTAALDQNWEGSYLELTHPMRSLPVLISSTGVLLISLNGALAKATGFGAAGLAIYATVKAVFKARAAKPEGLVVVLGGAMPLACALVAGALRLYPVLNYPRMLLFALPSLALLLGYAADAILARAMKRWRVSAETSPRAAVFVVCAAAMIASQVIYFRYPRPAEENRPAVMFIQSRLGEDDLLLVSGGMYEQFKYYRTALAFRPRHIYLANEEWPCCATDDRQEATDPSAKSLADDLSEAARRARGHDLWLLFPAGTPGHWSRGFLGDIDSIPATLARGGCTQEVRKLFGQTLVEAYTCR